MENRRPTCASHENRIQSNAHTPISKTMEQTASRPPLRISQRYYLVLLSLELHLGLFARVPRLRKVQLPLQQIRSDPHYLQLVFPKSDASLIRLQVIYCRQRVSLARPLPALCMEHRMHTAL